VIFSAFFFFFKLTLARKNEYAVFYGNLDLFPLDLGEIDFN
jgi:hypothetical protein